MKRLLSIQTGCLSALYAALGGFGLVGCIPQNSNDVSQLLNDTNGKEAVTDPSPPGAQPLVDPNLVSGGLPEVEELPPPVPASGVAIGKLNQASTMRPVVTLDPVQQIPTSIQMNVPVPDTSSPDKMDMALSYFEAYKDLYNLIEPASQLFPVRYVEDADGQHLFLGQQRDGVIVYAAELAVHLSGDRVLGTNGHYLPYVPAAPSGAMDAAAAQEVAAAFAGVTAANAEGVPSRFYFNESLLGGPDKGTHLVWSVSVRGDCGQKSGCELKNYFVDAVSGELLWTESARHSCNKSIVIANTGGNESNVCFYDPFVNLTQLWFTESGVFCPLPGACAQPDNDGNVAFNAAHKTYDYFANTFNRCGWDGQNGTVDAYLHGIMRDTSGNPSNNAKYDNACDFLLFTDGMVTLDIFAHEFTHGVTRATSGLKYANQSGALNESYSDVFGAMVNGGWLIGVGCAAGTLRDMQTPTNFVQPDQFANYVNTTADNGGVHTNSGIPNHVAYLIADGGVFNGVTVYKIGRQKLQQLYYAVLTTRLTTNSQFIDARDATVNLAREWAQNGGKNGFNMYDVGTVIRAFNACGIGAADTDGDGFDDNADTDDDGDHVPDAIDNCPMVQNPYQEDTDHDGQGDACDNDMDNDLVSNINDNCPFTKNPDQTDTDGDGVGDACDNCPNHVEYVPGPGLNGELKPYANPDQTDTDHDGQGNVCDNDDDNDGVPDISDNCPLVKNPSQIDYDGNGIGLDCDRHEQEIFKEPVAPSPKDYWKIDLCAGGCPGWLTDRYSSVINVLLQEHSNAVIVDQTGRVFSKAKSVTLQGEVDQMYAFELHPQPSMRYVFPARASMFVNGLAQENGRAVLNATTYFVRVSSTDWNGKPISVPPLKLEVSPLKQ